MDPGEELLTLGSAHDNPHGGFISDRAGFRGPRYCPTGPRTAALPRRDLQDQPGSRPAQAAPDRPGSEVAADHAWLQARRQDPDVACPPQPWAGVSGCGTEEWRRSPGDGFLANGNDASTALAPFKYSSRRSVRHGQSRRQPAE